MEKDLVLTTLLTFFCKNIGNLILIPKKVRYNLVINYKFFAPYYVMCIEHVSVSNYWSLVKQEQKVTPEEQILILCTSVFKD